MMRRMAATMSTRTAAWRFVAGAFVKQGARGLDAV